MNKISIQELALQAVDTMIKEGYKPITAWWQYENNLTEIVKLHEQQGLDVLSEETVSLYSRRAKERYKRGKISYSHLRYLVNSAERFVESLSLFAPAFSLHYFKQLLRDNRQMVVVNKEPFGIAYILHLVFC